LLLFACIFSLTKRSFLWQLDFVEAMLALTCALTRWLPRDTGVRVLGSNGLMEALLVLGARCMALGLRPTLPTAVLQLVLLLESPTNDSKSGTDALAQLEAVRLLTAGRGAVGGGGGLVHHLTTGTTACFRRGDGLLPAYTAAVCWRADVAVSLYLVDWV
jgi:hypothetical protein